MSKQTKIMIKMEEGARIIAMGELVRIKVTSELFLL